MFHLWSFNASEIHLWSDGTEGANSVFFHTKSLLSQHHPFPADLLGQHLSQSGPVQQPQGRPVGAAALFGTELTANT